ncbi:MAG: cysteine--tRNA ligase [Rhodothermales bacterium]
MALTLRLYNTLTRSVEAVRPIRDGHLSFYSCGPTVYSYAHIGNFRSFITADLIYRTARALGFDVSYATNITDVGHLTEDDISDAGGEDRMAKALRSKEGEAFANVWDLARHYAEELESDWQRLNLLEPSVRPRATEHMREQIQAVERLLADGHAYETASGVYFSVASFPEYGRLSGNRDAEGLEQRVRNVVDDPEKRDPRDFALWKKDDAHLMQWYSPWGWGFPGWHIECSVMAMAYLGDEIDIHAGGEDLIFPHHECEIAQSESLTGKPFARHWVHTRFLQVEGEKMSKSSGNFFTVRQLVAPESDGGRGIDPLAIRMTLLAGHYRKPFNFTFETVKAHVRHRERIVEASKLVDTILAGATDTSAEFAPEGPPTATPGDDNRFAPLMDRALEAMADDLNTPSALAVLFEGVKQILSAGKSLPLSDAHAARAWLDGMNDLLGVVDASSIPTDAAGDPAPNPEDARIDALLAERMAARASRDFARADAIRDQIAAMGIEIMDTPEGARWKRKSNV